MNARLDWGVSMNSLEPAAAYQYAIQMLHTEEAYMGR